MARRHLKPQFLMLMYFVSKTILKTTRPVVTDANLIQEFTQYLLVFDAII
jgi:hypothetical protein